jgi:hypothetical protein
MFGRLIIAAFLALGISGAEAAGVTANSIISAQNPSRGVVQFKQGTDAAGTYKTLYTGGANGSICFGLWATNSEAATPHLLTVQVVNSTVLYGGTAVTLPAGAGFATGIPPVPISSAGNWPGLAVDQNGNAYVTLINGDTLQATFASAFVTGSAVINAQVTCLDY